MGVALARPLGPGRHPKAGIRKSATSADAVAGPSDPSGQGRMALIHSHNGSNRPGVCVIAWRNRSGVVGHLKSVPFSSPSRPTGSRRRRGGASNGAAPGGASQRSGGRSAFEFHRDVGRLQADHWGGQDGGTEHPAEGIDTANGLVVRPAEEGHAGDHPDGRPGPASFAVPDMRQWRDCRPLWRRRPPWPTPLRDIAADYRIVLRLSPL
jgi:hypothetical protein